MQERGHLLHRDLGLRDGQSRRELTALGEAGVQGSAVQSVRRALEGSDILAIASGHRVSTAAGCASEPKGSTMNESKRRDFLKTLVASAPAISAGGWLAGLGYAQSGGGPDKVVVNGARKRATMDPRLMGAFLEHLGRAIYGGVYEPDSPLADANGYREDVVREMQELSCPIMRYPGGNFVSGYDWLHGVGPRKDRPAVLERAWNSIETNQFGTNEFIDWCKLVGTEPLLATNLGTGTPETSAALVEYCNVEKGNSLERPAQGARLRAAAQRQEVVPRQRDGRLVADRPHAGPRIRPQGAGCGPPDPLGRSVDRAHRLRLQRAFHADLPGLGSRDARGMLSRRSTDCPSTATTATRRTRPAGIPPASWR